MVTSLSRLLCSFLVAIMIVPTVVGMNDSPASRILDAASNRVLQRWAKIAIATYNTYGIIPMLLGAVVKDAYVEDTFPETLFLHIEAYIGRTYYKISAFAVMTRDTMEEDPTLQFLQILRTWYSKEELRAAQKRHKVKPRQKDAKDAMKSQRKSP